MAGMLQSEQAARRLGVKLPTLYAYVSRGIIASHPSGGGRRRLFAADDVEALARRRRAASSNEPKIATVVTRITEIREDGPLYRGLRAGDLAMTATYEEVSEQLWGRDGCPGELPWPPMSLAVPQSLSTSDRVRWIVLMAGSADRSRGDLRVDAVTSKARALIATIGSVLGHADGSAAPLRTGGRHFEHSVAGIVSSALISRPGPAHVRAVNATMVLLADHELAASTLAVRVAASTRADLYDALLAGLGAMAGPWHSGAPVIAEAFLREAERLGAEHAIDGFLRRDTTLPGFGHSVYLNGDARFPVLRDVIETAAPARWSSLLASVLEAAESRGAPPPNVDLGLAAMALAFGMPPGAGKELFTVARVAGWVAHYLEELDEPPLRYRTRAIYAAR